MGNQSKNKVYLWAGKAGEILKGEQRCFSTLKKLAQAKMVNRKKNAIYKKRKTGQRTEKFDMAD